MYKLTKTEKIIIETRKIPTCEVKVCNCFDNFEELIDEAKYSVKKIFIDKYKINKRYHLDDMKDVFDNDVKVKYFFNGNNLYIGLGDYYNDK